MLEIELIRSITSRKKVSITSGDKHGSMHPSVIINLLICIPGFVDLAYLIMILSETSCRVTVNYRSGFNRVVIFLTIAVA